MTLQRRNILASNLAIRNDIAVDSTQKLNSNKSEVRRIFGEQRTVIFCYEKGKSL